MPYGHARVILVGLWGQKGPSAQGKKMEYKPKLLGPDIFRWGGGSSAQRGGGQNVRYVPRNPGKTNFLAGYAGILPGCPGGARRVIKKKFVFNVCPLSAKGHCNTRDRETCEHSDPLPSKKMPNCPKFVPTIFFKVPMSGKSKWGLSNGGLRPLSAICAQSSTIVHAWSPFGPAPL